MRCAAIRSSSSSTRPCPFLSRPSDQTASSSWTRVTYLENVARGQVVDDPDLTRLIKRKWDSLLGAALSEQASLELITKLKVTQ
ncbi:Scr1 family TA system antitoxin-like transcriptional regulator [Micromonospora sp. NBC_01796]|uniref:Scr1 family TA system antitoxin-like transcriptional regulator n=1 Tax=Micromonospora sp. NBC_01796 TaxID=2975987 RepID=UPI002DD9FE02|nr:Scr1 family TA system antitoxin-like transcriptional regulator [Micromonospora sp. NBC_01796]WSA87699.1 Scr1 family TA system antitoxin-like transcriptional regulator [Micromonospora sp. NBC_01796]